MRYENPLLERVPTGIPGLDTVLKGGLLKSGVYLVVGTPGTGKTILANQMCFHHAGQQGKAVYITLLAESHDRMISYVRSLSFFKLEAIPDQIKYISGYQTLESENLSGLLELIRKEVRSHQATLLVLDGFVVTDEIGESELSVKKMLHELQALGTILGFTTLLLTIKDQRAHRIHPGFTMVDGIIELSDSLVGPRAVRELQIVKLRGSPCLRGKHTHDITEHGMVVYPRTEVLLANAPEVAGENRSRLTFGIKELDTMLGGGVLSGSMTTLLGAPGTGKTLVGASFLTAGAAKGEKGIYFGFYEPPHRLVEKAKRVNIDIQRFWKNGMIDIVWQPPLEHLLDSLTERLLHSVEKMGARRVFIDGLEGFKSATVYPDRIGAYLAALTNELRSRDVTVIFSDETELYESHIEMPIRELAAVIENILYLRHVEIGSVLHRLISIIKVRESEYDPSIRRFRIASEGILVERSFEEAEGVLTGHGRRIGSEKGNRG